MSQRLRGIQLNDSSVVIIDVSESSNRSTVAVLGIDGADYRLINEFGCKNIKLDTSRTLDSVTYSLDVPATLEVWPTIATGLHPTDHGISIKPEDRADSKLLRTGHKLLDMLPSELVERLVEFKNSFRQRSMPTTDADHMFIDGLVYNWPGITSCKDWIADGDMFSKLNNKKISHSDFNNHQLASSGKCIGWLAACNQTSVPIAGTHIHALDYFGHAYAERPELLRDMYIEIDSMVGWLADIVEDLVIISDHGMRTAMTNKNRLGIHSSYAMVSSTFGDQLPESVTEFKQWIEPHLQEETAKNIATGVDAPEQHLKNLGYL